MELIWDGLATFGLVTLLLLSWFWWQGDDEPPAPPARPNGPSGPSWPPVLPTMNDAAGRESVARQAAAAQWEQDQALLIAARQMLGAMQDCQAEAAAGTDESAPQDGAVTSRRDP